jgi:hypothetical protein
VSPLPIRGEAEGDAGDAALVAEPVLDRRDQGARRRGLAGGPVIAEGGNGFHSTPIAHQQRISRQGQRARPRFQAATASLRGVEDYTNKYKGEQVELALFGGEYQEGTLTAYCSIEDVPHVELNGHILVPLQNVASLHCSSRCDAPEPDWPPRGLDELDRDDRPDDEEDEG